MDDSDYEKVFEFARDRLNQKPKVSSEDITDCIQNVRKIFSSGQASFVFSIGDGVKMSEDDYTRLHQDLSDHFINIKMEAGMSLQGEEQRKRNTKWYPEEFKPRNNNYYWDKLKKDLKSDSSSDSSTLDKDTDVVMGQIGDPRENNFGVYGMVVGNVQSGKTLNYTCLIHKAMDAGYKLIVILAGDKENLRSQTQKRLNERFMKEDKKQPISLTTEDYDFNKRDSDRDTRFNLEMEVLFYTVLKKNSKILDAFMKWLDSQRTSKHAILLIDDESDYASVDTKRAKEEASAINKKIREILNRFKKYSYVGYTATPFANIFINYELKKDNLPDLFPQDFVYPLRPPKNYFGAQKIFIDHPEKFLINIEDYKKAFPIKHKKEHQVLELPESLVEAIFVFCLNITIRCLRGQEKHNSMLVNVTRFNDVQRQISEKLEELKGSLHSFITEAKKVFDRRFVDHKHLWEQVQEILPETLSSVSVELVNQKSEEFSYPKDKKLNVIVVGGASLSRGFTLEGLSVSYFIRDSKSYDTLMQMGRWFGYRDGYEDLCKIYMPEKIQENFRKITNVTNNLMDQLEEMNKKEGTPLDFGLAVQKAAGLRPTSGSKMRNAQIRTNKKPLPFFGVYRFVKHKQVHEKNLRILSVFVKSKEFEEKGFYKVCRRVSREDILGFIEEFEQEFEHKEILNYLNKKDDLWDVYFNNEGRKEVGEWKVAKRNAEVEGNYLKRKFPRLSHQRVVTEIKERPALILYILELTTEDGENPLEGILVPAYEVSFPRNVQNQAQEKEERYYNAQQDDLYKEEEEEDN
ncbi:Z1 domain-containing protein [Helicobacter suis]|uniref:Z1 domain-containing protein n=1 Tax=Helicobacter suis TaxID=104628 RepID=UPI0013D00D08|nr:Z1 domain-containing protein [Helicobacter suis]